MSNKNKIKKSNKKFLHKKFRGKSEKTSITIPEDVYFSIKIPDSKKNEVIQKELALTLYQCGYLSFGKARELAKMSKWDFHEELGKRKIERHYDKENLKEDLEYGKSQ